MIPFFSLQPRARRLLLLGAALALSLLLAACQDTWTYAREMGITLPEAQRRLSYQDGIGELNGMLRANEADTFAGLWIEHQPAYRIVARFTRDGEDTIRPYLEGRPFAHLVEVRGAEFTLAELEAIQAQALRELDKLDFGVSVSLSVQENRVQVPVSDRAWVESELRRAGAQLPEGVELIEVPGASTARDKDRLLTPPVPGVAFPRQKPVEGVRACMAAELIGTLHLDGECLYVTSFQGEERVLPVWPPEYTLRREGEQLLVIDDQGRIAARVGQEVYMGGGHVPVSDEWVLGQVPQACRGAYFVVGCEVRPNLATDAELVDVVRLPSAGGDLLFVRARPALDGQVAGGASLSGELVRYDYRRCLQLQTESGPGSYTLIWPAGWSVRMSAGEAVVVDETGQALARLGDAVSLRGRPVPHTTESPVYRQLIDELPGDCIGTSWLVDEIE